MYLHVTSSIDVSGKCRKKDLLIPYTIFSFISRGAFQ